MQGPAQWLGARLWVVWVAVHIIMFLAKLPVDQRLRTVLKS